MKSIFTDDDLAFMRDHYLFMTYKEIGDCLGFRERQIRGKINNLKWPKNRVFDKRYFQHIDSADKAYWLGLMYADGWIADHTTGKECSIELNDSDAYLLSQFNTALGGVHQVKHKSNSRVFNGYTYNTNTAVLRVYSNDMFNDLYSHGFDTNKTYSDRHPTRKDYGDFIKDFVRGYLDGDGCIYIDKSGHPTVSFTCGNVDFLCDLSTSICDSIGVCGHIYQEKEYKYRLMYFKHSDVKILLDWIYDCEESPMLIRKYEKYQSVYGLAS